MKHLLLKIGTWIALGSLVLLPTLSFAQTFTGLEGSASANLQTTGTASSLSTAITLPTLIGNFIKVLLSILGVVFVALMVYAGFLYFTSAGVEDKVKTAKKLFSQTIIGLILIVSAYAISDFVIDALVAASK